MRKIMLSSALYLAVSALIPLLAAAQTQIYLQILTPSTLQPAIEASLTKPAFAFSPAPSSSLTLASLPVAPSATRSAEFAAIFAVACSTRSFLHHGPEADSADGAREPCVESPNPYTRFLDNTTAVPLSPLQKAHLALRNLTDPGNLATITYIAALNIGINSHTAYGPGGLGFARNAGYSLLQDATGEAFGTFFIPSIAHEDPHYHRMPHASIPRRFLHAVSRTVIAQSDSGASMPNFASLMMYPITAEIGNLYVPGINGNGPSTVRRIMLGYAADPADNLITEFLPDFARRIHIRVIFVQRVLNPVSSDEYSLR
jgi:hypothetical protein